VQGGDVSSLPRQDSLTKRRTAASAPLSSRIGSRISAAKERAARSKVALLLSSASSSCSVASMAEFGSSLQRRLGPDAHGLLRHSAGRARVCAARDVAGRQRLNARSLAGFDFFTFL
jgi:hypothetical protein